MGILDKISKSGKKVAVAEEKAAGKASGKAEQVAAKEATAAAKAAKKLKKLGKGLVGARGKKASEAIKQLDELARAKISKAAGKANRDTYKKVFSKSIQYNAGKNGIGITYKVFQRNDIDWGMVRKTGVKKGIGLTNAEAASKHGLAPILNKNGNVATLHHSQQRSGGSLFEASTRYHNISNAKKPLLHPYKGKLNPDSPMDEKTRELFQKKEWI